MQSEIFSQDHIFINVVVNNQDDAFKLIAQKFVELGYATDYKKALKGLHGREKEGSTGFNDGVAIPHAKIKSITRPGVFVFQFDRGVEWNSIDGSLVKVAIALAIPDKKNDDNHLRILSTIARSLVNDQFRHALVGSQDANKLYELLNAIEI